MDLEAYEMAYLDDEIVLTLYFNLTINFNMFLQRDKSILCILFSSFKQRPCMVCKQDQVFVCCMYTVSFVVVTIATVL